MVKEIKKAGLSPEQEKRIKAAQKRHAAADPGCEKLAPEDLIHWHPAGGMSWEERAQAMKAAGIAQGKAPALGAAPNE
jgi:hypothetical protein